ncbi:MAG: glycine cleavage system protein T, partial [Lentisphaerae bacterium]|nr:glycine cleavage system protein T [Lentisphaerota bacterium]
GRAIGFASVTPPAAAPGARWLVDTGRARLPAEVVQEPFIKKEPAT